MKRKNYKVANGLPRYCIEIDGASFEPNARKTCDYKVNIASDELEDLSILSDPVFSLTKGLYRNNIWNSNNHIIFMLHQEAFDAVPFTMLLSKRQWNFGVFGNKTRVIPKPETKMKKFVFKFFWRFFRGLKTIICERTFCERYNPFTEEVVTYYGKENEAYFDFSLDNMHKKSVGYFSDVESTELSSNGLEMTPHWMFLLLESLQGLERSLNCTFEHLDHLLDEYKDAFGHDIDVGQKYGAHLQSRNMIIVFESMSISDTDYSVSVDSGVVCLITPHSQLVPQYLVIFKAFTPVVWIFIVITITIFIFMQHLFQVSQSQTFQQFYSNSARSSYEGTSSMLTVFSYFICGSPPRLLLGRFYTGKVLFTVFSFATIIISTVFLDGMTTLLTKQVRYSEINSLKDMEDANLFIQVSDVETTSKFFLQENKYKALATKLTNSSHSLKIFFFAEMVRDLRLFDQIINLDNWTDFVMDLARRTEYEDYWIKNVINLHAIYESDAYLERIPQSTISKQSVSITRFLQERPMSYHLVAESLMTYPLSFTFVRNSFLFEKLNDKLAQMSEAGFAQRTVDSFVNDRMNMTEPHEQCDHCEPRPYDLRDLRLAFIALLSVSSPLPKTVKLKRHRGTKPNTAPPRIGFMKINVSFAVKRIMKRKALPNLGELLHYMTGLGAKRSNFPLKSANITSGG
ncbi:unnamed protein product [Bemisia tabaci]|uniref:Ionotropic receptor n=1 Tax=Bemisia tabaci TaxID=7038 RepID=A0A9P0AIF5_BEMTA|nr:unnamed protein product [Bemisia tabaci]